MNPLTIPDRLFNKPYYFFRPRQLLTRVSRLLGIGPTDPEQVTSILPWGLPLTYWPSDIMGSEIARTGVYDICVAEVLWRLAEPGETAVDAGANIGEMSSVLCLRVGPKGRVHSFEPHPHLFQELSANIARWRDSPLTGECLAHEAALSSAEGTADLFMPSTFAANRGTATLESPEDDATGTAHSVLLTTLDRIFPDSSPIGVLKADVEGHELDLLKGASALLENGRIRDILFEDLRHYPSPVSDHLERFGYTVFDVAQGPLGLRVAPAAEMTTRSNTPSYLATLDPARALRLLTAPGYGTLGVGPRKFQVLLAVSAATLVASVLLLRSRSRTDQSPPPP